MKTYIEDTGEKYLARGARDLIRQMRSRSPLNIESNQEAWMHGVASRVRRLTGQRLPIDSESSFVRGLVRFGVLTEKP